MITREQLEGPQKVTWCTGCGNFGILAALKKTVIELDVPKHELCLVSGIGCSGKFVHYINLNSFHTLHGRPIPVATGVHVVNPDLHVIVHTGDGDCLGEGLGHFLHAARRNVNISVFLHNNGVNGLTKGQYSPTSPEGYVSKTSPPPEGVPMKPIDPVALAITAGATYVARGFAGDQKQLVELMKGAVKHKGFAIIDILQPCVTFNRELTWKFYNANTYSLQDNGHDVTDRMAAISRSMEPSDKVPVGLFYRDERSDLLSGLATPDEMCLKDHSTSKSAIKKILDEMTL